MGTPLAGNGLALLANKCAANVFDISSGMVHASIRDQIVRAQLLVRDLVASDPSCKKILVVGAGVAGVAAALAASHLKIDVLVVEAHKIPFHLQKKVTTRFVGPFMYEWPNSIHQPQDYPLSSLVDLPMEGTPKWESREPIAANMLAENLTEWLKKELLACSGLAISFWFRMNPDVIKAYVTDFANRAAKNHDLWMRGLEEDSQSSIRPSATCIDIHGKEITSGIFIPDYVILAAGMGDETITLGKSISGKRFWEDDDLRSEDTCRKAIGVFGGGDGALQDVLRILTIYDHPLQFIAKLNEFPEAQVAITKELPYLESLEQQSRLVGTWTKGDVPALIDQKCMSIAKKLAQDIAVRTFVEQTLRQRDFPVHHFVREIFFSKAYLLNRFCVHLIYQCMQIEGFSHRDGYYLHWGANLTTVSNISVDGVEKYRIDASTSFGNVNCMLDFPAVVRYGIPPGTVPGRQMIMLNESATKDRISMAGIPLPFVVAGSLA